MINPMSNPVNHLSIFQICRGREYAGSRFETSSRPERFKKVSGPYVRLKTSIYTEESFRSAPLSGTRMLERILLPSFGTTAVKFYGHQPELLWSYPSAGGCYPVEVYVVIRSMDGIEPGIYYYSALQTLLYKMPGADAADLLCSTLLEQDHNADFYFVLSIVPWRTCWKYSHKGYHFSLIDSGHAVANFQLILHALGLDHSVYTITKSKDIKSLLQLDDHEEPVAVIAVRHPSTSDEGSGSASALTILNEHAAFADHTIPSSEDKEESLFDWKPIADFQAKVSRSVREPSEGWLARHALPAEWDDYNQILRLLIERRSSPAYALADISRDHFWRMLDFIHQLNIYSSFYMVVHAVEDMLPGIYHFDGQLRMIEAGDFRQVFANLCLGQALVHNCSILFFFVMDVSQADESDLALFQQRAIADGILGQLMYLKSQELQLAYSAIGGYYDEEVRELLQLPHQSQIMYAGAWGKGDPNSASIRKLDRYVLNKPGNGLQ